MKRASFNDGWQAREKVNPFAELAGAATPYTPVRLPHDILIGRDRSPDGHPSTAFFPDGVYQYRKTFASPEATTAVLEFEGVYRDAVVTLNGSLVARHRNGYTGFTADLTGYLQPGENTIMVEARTQEDSRWYSGAGIYRPVWLWTGGDLRIEVDGLTVTTPDIDEHRAVAEVAAVVCNDGATLRTVRLRARVTGPDGAAVLTNDTPFSIRGRSRSTARLRLAIPTPRLWSPDHPDLYRLELEVVDGGDVLDTDGTGFGIRRLQVDAVHGLRINGELVKLRGACIHHDSGVLGAATFASVEDRRIRLLKQAGFNAIRSAHNPAGKALLEAADRHGVLVMDEFSDVWLTGKNGFDYSLDFPEEWKADVEAMVRKDVNHPSVVFYSIGNEIPEVGSPTGAILGRELAEAIRSLDGSRFITNGVNGMLSVMDDLKKMTVQHRQQMAEDDGAGINTMMNQVGEFLARIGASQVVTSKTEESFSLLDVAGMNYLEARYELDKDLFPDRVIVGTETAPPIIDKLWRLTLDNPHVIGDFTWTGWDYLGEAGAGRVQYPTEGGRPSFEGEYPWLTAAMGDFDITGHRKPQSYYREIVFGLRPEPYIAVQRPERYGQQTIRGQWSWTDSISSWSWRGHEGKPVVVEVYSDADEVELVVNGTSQGRKPAGEANRFTAEFDLTYDPGTIEAIAYRAGAPAERFALTSAATAGLIVQPESATVAADGSDVALVTILVADADGNVETGSDLDVTLIIEGPGEQAGFGSANPCTEEGFAAATHGTFDGRAQVAIRATGPGEIRIIAEAPGVTSGRATLTAKTPEPHAHQEGEPVEAALRPLNQLLTRTIDVSQAR